MEYAILVLLANVWTCLQGNQTSMRFECIPPTVKEYLALPPKEDDNSSKEEMMEAFGRK